MDWDLLVKVALAVLAVAAAAFRVPFRPKSKRDQIRADIEILKELPSSSKSKDRLTQYIDQRVEKLIEDETERRRNPGLIFNGLFVGGFGLFTLISFLEKEDLSSVVQFGGALFAGFMVFTAARMLRDGIQVKKRNSRGFVIE
ncbi:hypothetical protein ACQPZK_02030 [Micromonospora sp. CA-249363]|uniref:hypothetical protein n=1 Tax=Micromonospora sp. CA-249363 TaxID=3239963 RepID=UPI003D92D02A